ncbi:class I SAM-dependent methyltransferase [Georgenia faecalis]|uniref:Class I SAM-dependent methyltransferase n=1 Tax=Georgenia faecalis TaxID=2483799 RepID=A0ABV9D9X2_9MICO|nr:class I SAM-dependent methyltransferase [Georgenia faecalis]
MPIEEVRAAYGRRAREYVERFGSVDAAAEEDRRLVAGWAAGIDGPILDVGCGPGQWTAFLHASGADVAGLDPTTAFVESARARFPGVPYRVGRAEDLGVEDATLGGVLAWYSLIHIEPDGLGAVLAEIARAVRPGGGLVVGFFAGPGPAPFAHAVTTAYTWPVAAMAAAVEDAGFTVTETHGRTAPGSRPHGALLARRRVVS